LVKQFLFLLLGQAVVAALAYLVKDGVNLFLVLALAGIVLLIGFAPGVTGVCRRTARMLALLVPPLHIVEELLTTATAETLTRVGVLLPVADEKEAEEHAPKVSHVGHAVTRTTHGREQLNANIAHYQPLGLNGEREGNDKETLIGENHTKGEQDSVDRSRGTDGSPKVDVRISGHLHAPGTHILVGGYTLDGIVGVLDDFLDNTSSDTTRNVIKKEFLRTPYPLYDTTEHPEGEHIEENMCQTAMEKHVGKKLVEVEITGHKEMKTEQRGQVYTPELQNPCCNECQKVDNQQILGHGRHIIHQHYFTNRFTSYNFLLFRPQNYEKYPSFCSNSGLYKLFFKKKLNFFHFLFVF
jgi:hypothetical protein